MHLGSGSVVPSRTGFTPTGSPRPSRPGQIDPGLIEGIAGGADPSVVSEMSHASAAALLDRVHHSADPQVVERVLTLVDREGVDMIAELWSRSEPDSLPGIMWRLYTLRSWMRRDRDLISRLWRLGEPVATAASAIAGVDQAPTEADITHTADSILAGAFTGDFAVALESERVRRRGGAGIARRSAAHGAAGRGQGRLRNRDRRRPGRSPCHALPQRQADAHRRQSHRHVQGFPPRSAAVASRQTGLSRRNTRTA